MTFRERIADWISGGSISTWRRLEFESRDRANKETMKRFSLEHRLSRIAAQETPSANATVKRMARIARGEDK